MSNVIILNESYKSFIEEALKRSVLIEVGVYWPPKKYIPLNKDVILKSGITEEFYEYRNKIMEKEYQKEKNVFDNVCIHFLKKLSEYFLSNETLEDRLHTYHIRPCSELLPILLEPAGFGNWMFPKYPDSISFVAPDGGIWFCCSNHGIGNVSLYPNDESDYEYWRKKGIIFQCCFDDSKEWKRPYLNKEFLHLLLPKESAWSIHRAPSGTDTAR